MQIRDILFQIHRTNFLHVCGQMKFMIYNTDRKVQMINSESLIV